MNERIKQLIDLAGGISHDDDGQELTPMLLGSGLEHFAELIIRECADICDRQARANWNDDRKTQARLDRDLIKASFRS